MATGGAQESGSNVQRHAGVVRGALNRRPPNPPRRDWLAAGVVAGLTVVALLIVANLFGSRAVDVAVVPTPSHSPISSLPTFVQETPGPTPTLAPTPTPSPTPTPAPTQPPTPTATPTPSPAPTPPPTPRETPLATAAPTATPIPAVSPGPVASPVPAATVPAYGLVIVEPADGSATVERAVVIRGLVQPGAIITRVVPFWFDEHTTADAAGRWSFVEQLNLGENTFTFRVADDSATEVALTVYYSP